MGVELEEIDRGAGVVYAHAAGIWVMTLFAEPTDADMKRARGTLRIMAERYPGGFPTLTWVLAQAGYRMESDARATAAEVTKSFDRSIAAQATLIEGGGFQGAAVRAIIASLELLSRSTGPKKVFAELAPAVSFCLAHRPAASRSPTRAEDVVATLVTLRTSLAGRGSP